LGATTRATHAIVVKDEFLGLSDGEPGQIFRLQNVPVLALRPGESVTVEEKRDGEWVPVPWTLVPDFSNSNRYDRHFTLDTATGEVAFGPAIRQPDGSVRQYGRVPEANRQIYFTQYRHGGGVAGNVPAGRIQMLKSAVPYIDSVTNLRRAEGGRDQETLDEAKFRARREVRAQQRAVTADDYVVLARGASRAVARVKCLTPSRAAADAAVTNLPPGMLELLVVPAVFDALRNGDLSKLALDEPLSRSVEAHLEPFRLLTTTVRVREPRYVGVRVYAEIVVSEYSDAEGVRAAVRDSLRQFIAPLDLTPPDQPKDDILGARWEGWPFGRSLFIAEIFSLIQRVPGVKHVLDVRLSQRLVVPRSEVPRRGEALAAAAPLALPAPGAAPETDAGADDLVEPPLAPVDQRRLDIPADALLVSLDHEIRLVVL
jgi:predicted phage baseplate assembly protein